MKKEIKIVLTVLAAIIICYGTFVITDCIRLRDSFELKKPLITINESTTENRHIYEGLGYSVEYSINPPQEGNVDTDLNPVYGAQFLLFNNIRMWAWVS